MVRIVLLLLLFGAVSCERNRAEPSPATSAARAEVATSLIPFEEARPLIGAHRAELPVELGGAEETLRATWPQWLRSRDGEIRARVARGDEDSVVNLWLYGTSFTTLPRVTPLEVRQLQPGWTVERLLLARLDDLVAALATPGLNERLQLARRIVERAGATLQTEQGRDVARAALIDMRERVLAENARYRGQLDAASRLDQEAERLRAYASLYAERGLSSDTSLLVDFAVDQAIVRASAEGRLLPRSLHRVAILGPGLDFTDKAEGHDFYPVQTIQPFAFVDSLVRAGVAADDLEVTTFDLSPRVNQHLQSAKSGAQSGQPYVIQLPLEGRPISGWSADLTDYWQRMGSGVGDEVPAATAPRNAGSLRLRAIRIRPDIVLRLLEPRDLNIVVERLELEPAARFDLVLATNVLVYYSPFEQALAVANLAHMLGPGGLLLTNYAVSGSTMMPVGTLTTRVFWDQGGNGDTMLWYERGK